MEQELHGRLEERGVAAIFSELAKRRESGILSVQSYPDMLTVSVLDGEVVSADAVDQTVEDGLGEVLNSRGLVSREDFASLLAEQEAGGGAVEDLLVERSFVEEAALLDALRAHVYQLCELALTWRTGEYRFYPGEEIPVRERMTPIPVEEVLIRAAQALGEEGPLDAPLPTGDSVFVRAVEIQESTKAGIPSESERLFALIDGRRTAAQLAAAAELSEYKVLYLMHRWERFGWVDLREGEIAAPTVGEDVAPFVEEPLIPEEEELPPPPPKKRERKPRRLPLVVAWPARGLGLGLLVVTLVSFWLGPDRLLLPFDWQERRLAELRLQQRTAAQLKIHRAAETFFLVHGHFPEGLARLAEVGLLRDSDLAPPSGVTFDYSSTVVSYSLRPLAADGSPTAAPRTVSIMGDFLLDPDYVVVETTDEPALVLLD